MEFQAYPAVQGSRRGPKTLWRVQGLLHGTDSVLLPCALLSVGAGLVCWQHMTDEDTGRHSIRNFLAKILVSMLPLAILECRIIACADPVGLFSRFSSKVLLMHTCFLFLRVLCMAFPDVQVGNRVANLGGFISACALLLTVFRCRPTLECLRYHLDVWMLAGVSCAAAVAEVLIVEYFKGQWDPVTSIFEDMVITGSDYIEILSFVPAVWMAYREAEGAGQGLSEEIVREGQGRALGLFAFLACFYLVEDIYNAFCLGSDFPLAAAGHTAHFLLLLDFAMFLLAHLCDPAKFTKLRGTLLNWFVDVCAV